MAKLSQQLWSAAKRAERGFGDLCSTDLLLIRAGLAGGADRGAATELLAGLGAEVVKNGKSGPVEFRLPALKVIELASLAQFESAELVSDKPPPKKKIPLAAALALGLLLLAGGALAIGGPAYWGRQARDAWGWVADFVGQWSDDGVPRRWKPKPKQPAGVSKRVKPKPPLPAANPEAAVEELYHQGLLAYHLGRRTEALALWQQALKKDPKVLGVRAQLGWALYEMGRKDQAREQFETILKMNPGDEGAVSALQIIDRDGDREDRSGRSPAGGP